MFVWSSAGTWRRPSARPEQPHNGIDVGFRTGQRAPDFELLSLDGSRVKLSDPQGQPVLLNFLGDLVYAVPRGNAMARGNRPAISGTRLRVIGVSIDDSGAIQNEHRARNDVAEKGTQGSARGRTSGDTIGHSRAH